MSETRDVVIVGGGIEGAAAAWALSQRGVTDVVVAERNTVASGMTGKSSGIVRCHYGVSSLAAMADRRPGGVREGRRDLRHRHRLPPDRLRRRRRRTERRVDAQEPCRPACGRRADRGDRHVRGRRGCGRSPTCRRSPRSAGRRAAATATHTRPRRHSRPRRVRPASESARAPTVTGLLVDGGRVTGIRLADGSEISAGTVVVATGVWTPPFLAPIRRRRAHPRGP